MAAKAAREQLATASADDLRELVAILAERVEALGDARPRRRPRHDEHGPSSTRAFAKRMGFAGAARDLRVLLICRDLVDKPRSVGPVTLSRLLFLLRHGLEDDPEGLVLPDLIQHRAARLAADPDLTAQLLEALHPLAVAELRDFRASPADVARRGFRAVYRRRVAARWKKAGIAEGDLEKITEKTSE